MRNKYGRALAIIGMVLLCPVMGRATPKVDMQMFTHDTQKFVRDERHVALVWWIPNEFWEVSAQHDPTMSPEMAQQFIAAVDDYLIFAVMEGEIGAFGGLQAHPREALLQRITITLAKDETLHPLLDNAFRLIFRISS